MTGSKRSRIYTDVQKAGAVLMVEAAGYPATPGAIERVARELKLPESTLKGWVKKGIKYGNADTAEEVEVLMVETRLELTDLLDKSLRGAISSLPDKLEGATYKETVIAIGIFVDKLQLLKGEPTSNNRLSGDPNSPIQIKAIDYRNAIASLAPRAVSDTDSSSEG